MQHICPHCKWYSDCDNAKEAELKNIDVAGCGDFEPGNADKKIELTGLTMTLGSYYSPASVVVDDNEIIIRFRYDTAEEAQAVYDDAVKQTIHDFGEDAYEEENKNIEHRHT